MTEKEACLEAKLNKNAIICSVFSCPFIDSIYCRHDLHECTPNSRECKWYLENKPCK